MKKKLSMALSLLLILTSVQSTYAYANSIENVSGVSSKIKELKKHGFVEGYGNGDLKLDNRITRAEMTKLLVYGDNQKNSADALANEKGKFTDVDNNFWANGVINAASKNVVRSNGLFMIQGYPDGTFRPQKNITNAELAKMLVVLTDSKLTQAEVDKMNKDWPNAWINNAKKAGLMEDVNIQEPNKIVNREEAFTMFYNGILRKSQNENNKSSVEVARVDDNSNNKPAEIIKVYGNEGSRETVKIINHYFYKDNYNDDSSNMENKKYNRVEDIRKATPLELSFLDYIRAQHSLNQDIYNINVDNMARNIQFTFKKITGIDEIKKQTKDVLQKMLNDYDEITVAIGEKYVVLNKDNYEKQLGPLVGLFIKATSIKDYVNAIISKSITKTVAVEVKKGNTKENVGYFNITFATEGYKFDTTNGELQGYEGNIEDIIKDNRLEIPEEIAGKKVTRIGDRSFSNLGLIEVVLPKTIKSIGTEAFAGNSLQSLNLPESLEEIGNGAFKGEYRWSNKKGNEILDLTIPDSVIRIGDYAFRGNRIATLNLGTKVEYIGDNAFSENNIDKISLPNTLKEINRAAFSNNALTEVNIPSSVTIIREWAFTNNNINKLILNEGVKRIFNGAFQQNYISKLTIPESVQIIEENAFRNQKFDKHSKEYSKIIIPKNTKVVPKSFDEDVILIRDGEEDNFDKIVEARKNLSKLLNDLNEAIRDLNEKDKSSIIREKRSEVDELLSNSQVKLEDLNKKIKEIEALIKNINPNVSLNIAESKSKLESNLKEAVEINKNYGDWNINNLINRGNKLLKDENVRKVEIDSLNRNLEERIKNLYIDNNYVFDKKEGIILKYIGKDIEVNIPSQIDNVDVKIIGDGAFENKSLRKITIPDSVTKIESGAFGSNQITSLTIPDSVTEIRNGAFMSNQISDLKLGRGLKTIENGAFSINQITSLTIPDSVTKIESGAFGSNKISDLKLGSGLELIEDEVFRYNNITSLTIPDNIRIIKSDAFSSNKISDLKLGSGLELIEDGVFSNNNITSLTIPDNIRIIKSNAFSRNQISDLKLGSGLQSIGEKAFLTNKLSNLVIPESVKYIDSGAFKDNQLKTVNVSKDCNVNDAFDENVKVNKGDDSEDVSTVSESPKINIEEHPVTEVTDK